MGVVEHFFEGPQESLTEAKRIIKKDGLLLISIPVLNISRKIMFALEGLFNFLRENTYLRRMLGKTEYPKKYFFEYKYSISEFEKILTNNNFTVIEKFAVHHSAIGLFNYFLEPPFFLSNGRLAFRLLEKFEGFLYSISKWIAPNQVLWVCKNIK